jgi:hypothetical protein
MICPPKKTWSQATVNLLNGAMGSFDKKQWTHPTALLGQEQTLAAAGANAGTHSMHNHRWGVMVFSTCHGGIQNFGLCELKVRVPTRVAYRSGSGPFFGYRYFRVSDILGIGIFGQYSRCVGKISSFMVPLSKNIYNNLQKISLHFTTLPPHPLQHQCLIQHPFHVQM